MIPFLLSPAGRLPGLHSGQAETPGGVRVRRGGLFWTSSAGASDRPAHPVLRNRGGIHLSAARDQSPSQSPGSLQHQGRAQRYHPLQERVPAHQRFLFSGKEGMSSGPGRWCHWRWKCFRNRNTSFIPGEIGFRERSSNKKKENINI